MSMRYLVQMSEFQAYKLALYDTKTAEIVAQFKDENVALEIRDYLNKAERQHHE